MNQKAEIASQERLKCNKVRIMQFIALVIEANDHVVANWGHFLMHCPLFYTHYLQYLFVCYCS